MSTMNDDVSSANKIKLIMAWGFVGIPLVWGVLQTLENAMRLFK